MSRPGATPKCPVRALRPIVPSWRYAQAGARYLVVDMDYYGQMTNPVQLYLKRSYRRAHLGDGYAIWELTTPPAPGKAAAGEPPK